MVYLFYTSDIIIQNYKYQKLLKDTIALHPSNMTTADWMNIILQSWKVSNGQNLVYN